MRFKNKSVFITGAARGIGKSFADAFAKEGAKVAIGDINIEQANNTIKEIGNGSIAIELDVTNQKSIEKDSLPRQRKSQGRLNPSRQ